MSKKIKVLIFILLVLPLVDVLYSCCGCGDVKIAHLNYLYKSFSLKNLDNGGESAVVSDLEQINKNVYGIRVFLQVEKIAPKKSGSSTRLGFISPAYATICFECPEEIFSPRDSVTSVKVFTLNDFDEEKSKNSDISEYFKVAHSFSSIDDYERYLNLEYDYMPVDYTIRFDFLLMKAPQGTREKHKFKVQIALSDGRILEQETTEIELI
ncbi:hypothetical protein AGMMS4957_12430 [Bacteroidia bacterium]|nr:hypothetical protein AGMMS4957_12430 [Bacteroidia bacterium]